MTRTRRVAGSVALSMLSQVAAMVVGLWLTRFILDRLGQHDYGVWLLILQALGYLALADIGVVAVLPRQTAFVTGRDAKPDELPRLVGETTRLVLWQTPIVMVLCGLAYLLIPGAWGSSKGPLAAMLAIFALGFPLRLFTAVLNGLQDLVFLGWLQLGTWLVNTIVVVAALLLGLKLYALVIAWGATQLLPPLLCWRRLVSNHPGTWPRRLPPLGWPDARRHLAAALWVSVGQLSQALVAGSDVLIVGIVMGPAAVVPYAVTLKLIQVVGNLPDTVAHASGPGLSQMRMGEARADLKRATDALAQAVLAVTGIVGCVVLAANRGFVGWWVGADRFGGMALTALGVAVMMVTDSATTVVYAAYSFGHERRLAVVGLLQGALAVGLSIALVRMIGFIGAPIATLIAVVGLTMPLMLPTLARETGTTVPGLLRAQVPFVLRVVLALAAALAIGWWIAPRGPLLLAVTSILAALVYVALILPVALRPPLREYVLQVLNAIKARFGFAPAAPAA